MSDWFPSQWLRCSAHFHDGGNPSKCGKRCDSVSSSMELCLPSSCQPEEDYRDELFRRLGTCISWNKTVLPRFLYTIWGDATSCQYNQCTHLPHTIWQVYTISASMRYDHTTNQTHPSPSITPKISAGWRPWCWIQQWWFLTVDQAPNLS